MADKRRVGRPTMASPTLEEALRRAYANELPARPRNEIERQVMGKKRGRKVAPGSPSRVAAQYASYLITNGGRGAREACREAARVYSLHPDTVRKILRAMLREPTVAVKVKQHAMFRQLARDQDVRVPLVPQIGDLPDEWQVDMK